MQYIKSKSKSNYFYLILWCNKDIRTIALFYICLAFFAHNFEIVIVTKFDGFIHYSFIFKKNL